VDHPNAEIRNAAALREKQRTEIARVKGPREHACNLPPWTSRDSAWEAAPPPRPRHKRGRQTEVEIVERMLAGDRRALARLVSIIEKESDELAEVMRLVQPHTGNAYCLGVTGAPGSGKSTLVDKLALLLRSRDRSVGIIALDPTSPFSGGAILGDRIRMDRHALDPGVFIRSMATRGSLGGLARAVRDTIRLFDASGTDFCIVETVGVGQIELDIVDTADTVVVVSMPETGDFIQVMKAGILEIADILVVNKADLPGSEKLVIDLEQMAHNDRRHPWWNVPVVPTEAKSNVGLEHLLEKIEAHRAALQETGQLALRRQEQRAKEFMEILERRIRDRLMKGKNSKGRLGGIMRKVIESELNPHSAAMEILSDRSLIEGWLFGTNEDP
jgi:LAO/AO transport system kinase